MNAPQIKTMLANPANESHERLYVPGDGMWRSRLDSWTRSPPLHRTAMHMSPRIPR